MTTPEESISAQAGLAHQPALAEGQGTTGPIGIDECSETDLESAFTTDAATERLADLPDEPGAAHVAAYAAAADELAQRLDDSSTGHDDSGP